MEITLGFLLIAFAAYTLFGGADFGGGILEATLWRHPKLQHKLQAALAPVWEANHVWLIAVIVILFIGFPRVYTELCTMLFVPIYLTLLGIVLRGTFFSFRKYDPEPETRIWLYNFLFRCSSALTPMMFGFIVAALLKPFPRIPSDGSMRFSEIFIFPWTTVMGLLCGLFVYALFGYTAAVFFYGELHDTQSRSIVKKRIGLFFVGTFISGGCVLAWGAMQGIIDITEAWNPVQIAAQCVAFAGIPWLWWSMRKHQTWNMRFAAGIQVSAILAGWFATQYPAFIRFNDGLAITVYNSAAPKITLFWLNTGLAVALAMVIPLLIYLYRVFGASKPEAEQANTM